MAKSAIKEIYKKYYSPTSPVANTPKMPFIKFLLLVCVDPTSYHKNPSCNAKNIFEYYIEDRLNWNFVNNILVKGHYVQWVINHQDEFKIEAYNFGDTSVPVTDALLWYDDNKDYLKEHDINKMNVRQLLALKQEHNGIDLSIQYAIDKAEMKGAEMVYCDADWAIVIPKTFEASCFYGQHTKWCTTERLDPSYFNNYSQEGPLYILIDRHSSHKYQLYFVKGKYDFRNEIDTSVYPWDINFSDGVRDFFKKASGSKGMTTGQIQQLLANGVSPYTVFDKVYPASCGRQMVRLDMRYNYIDVNTGLLVGPQWYFFAFPYDEEDGTAKVWIQRFTYTFVDIAGADASTEWIDDFDVDAWENTEYWE